MIFSGDFVNILCECDLPTYYPRFTVNNDQVRENINIVLVTMFNQFENFPKIFITGMLEGDYFGSIL